MTHRFSLTDPRESIIWEVERVQMPASAPPTTAALVVLACSLALLAGVIFRLIDQWVAW